MNATAGPTAADGGGFLGSQKIGGFGYGIGVSIGILLLITTITLASYFCTRGQHPSTSSTSVADHHHRHVAVEIPEEVGIDEATLKSYPKLVYSEKRQKIVKEDAPTAASCCSICLADYKSADVLRLLPDCGHLFHLKCVDPWLRKHPTCPVCRTSPFPSPMSTPLAEVVPLAGRPRG
ncbi:Putative RING-H2 finger protein ATL71 [Linum perenne]